MQATNLRKAVCGFLLTLGMVVASSTPAAILVLDFDDASGAVVDENYPEKGFILSSSTHYDAFDSQFGYQGTQWFGWDGSPGVENPDYLGPIPKELGALYLVHQGGISFSLISLWPVLEYGEWWLTSPKGGFFYTDYWEHNQTTIFFSGPEWSNVDWLLFMTDVGFPTGFDNLTLSISKYLNPLPQVC